MSSPSREPLNGIIRKECKIVGGICLPEKDVGLFIDQFNHCYGPLQLKIDEPSGLVRPQANQPTLPVGAGMFDPFRMRTRRPTETQRDSG